MARVGILASLLVRVENLSTFTIEYDVAFIMLRYIVFIMLSYVVSVPALLRAFVEMDVELSQMLFVCLSRWSYAFHP